jgi:hypothetical protein
MLCAPFAESTPKCFILLWNLLYDFLDEANELYDALFISNGKIKSI